MDKYVILRDQFQEVIQESGIKLDGLVLDLCSADISIASVYDQTKVVCYEFDNNMVKKLKKRKIKTVQANIRNQYFPFKSNSFDYSFCRGLPFKPSTHSKQISPAPLKETPENFIHRITSEIIRVTKKQAIINSCLFKKYFSEQYKSRIEMQDDKYSLMILDCKD